MIIQIGRVNDKELWVKLQHFQYRLRLGSGNHLRSAGKRKKKDRHTLLSRTAWELVQQYMKSEKPSAWLFPGQYPGTDLHERSLQKVFTEALTRSGVKKKVGIHGFDTLLPPIYSKTALTSGLSKNCGAMPTLPPPSAISMSALRTLRKSKARWIGLR